MPALSDAARDAVRDATQLGHHICVVGGAGIAQELLDAGMVSAVWVLDMGGRVRWPLTYAGVNWRTHLRSI